MGAVQADLSWIASTLETALGRMRTLEGDGNLVPGLGALLKAKGSELALSVEALRDACDGVPKKLTGSPEPITQYVDGEKVAEVRRVHE